MQEGRVGHLNSFFGLGLTNPRDSRMIPEHIVWSLFTQLVLALHECHHPAPLRGGQTRQVILHRDLKPDNGTGCVGVADKYTNINGLLRTSAFGCGSEHQAGRLWAEQSDGEPGDGVRQDLRWVSPSPSAASSTPRHA